MLRLGEFVAAHINSAPTRARIEEADLANGEHLSVPTGLPNAAKLMDKVLGTHYLTPEEQQAHVVTGKDGMLVMKSSGEPVHTQGVSDFTPHGEPIETDKALLVYLPSTGQLLSTGNADTGFIIDRPILNRAIKHSSLAAGQPADGTEVAAPEGKVTKLTNHSGHYQPDLAGFRQVVRALKTEGVDMSDAKFYIKRFDVPANGGTRGYRQIENPEVKEVAKSLQLGAYEGTAAEGEKVLHNFKLGQVTVGKDGKVEMVLTSAGPVPGSVLRQAESQGYGSFKQSVIHPNGTVEFRFNPAKPPSLLTRALGHLTGDPAATPLTPEPIKFKAPALKEAGVSLDEDRLPTTHG